jgi:aldose 1-epimerase
MLRAGDVAVAVDADHGARLRSLRVAGDELLVTDGRAPFGSHSFVMAPWAGRVRDAVARWDGRELHLPALDPPHALHGLVHDRPWEPLGTPTPSSGSWRTEVSADEWFAPLVLEQRVTATLDAVHLALSIAAPDAPAPATVGWHPWFRRELGGRTLTTELPDARCLERDAAGIASTTRGPLPDGPLDDCLVDLAGPVHLRWGDHLAVTVTSDAPATVVYTAHRLGVCVEPQSGPPDEVNTAPRVVVPGQPLTLHATLAVSRPER